ncbi:GNAT family N-acetyltransferase [Actinoplanes sp. NPDC049599]|jgi:RimJ/RimL family protein N-acetyltransferase|uniref:GNAT family N-acetyltransferase n=1 Tax=Actinoplanes sp. NPDC049599 TaxID=3363903 RepID=UPI0037B6ED47
MAVDFSVKPTLVGSRVVLRPFVAGDHPAICEALRDPEVVRLTGSQPIVWDAAAEQKMREWYDSRADQPDRLDLAVEERATGAWVGEVVLNKWDARHRSCNFRTMFGPHGRDRGLGTEAARLIVGYGFEQLGLHRIELEVYPFNPRARRTYEKVGFVAEQALDPPEGPAGTTVMAIRADEWRADQDQQG